MFILIFFHRLIFSCLRLRPDDFVGHDDSDDDSKKSKGTAEDLDDQHADECGGCLGVSECCSRTNAADREPAAEVAHSNDEADAENAVGRELRLLPDCRGIEKTAW